MSVIGKKPDILQEHLKSMSELIVHLQKIVSSQELKC